MTNCEYTSTEDLLTVSFVSIVFWLIGIVIMIIGTYRWDIVTILIGCNIYVMSTSIMKEIVKVYEKECVQ